jgi:hypothetical protein
MKTQTLVGVSSFVVLFAACGGKAKPAEEPAAAASPETPATAAPAGTDAPPLGAAPPADAPKADDAPPPPATPSPAPPPDVISCAVVASSCTEVKVGPDGAAPPRERCTASGGAAHDGPCSHDNVLATCTMSAKNSGVMYVYRSRDEEENKGLIAGAKPGCARGKGKFVVVPKAGGKGGGKH